MCILHYRAIVNEDLAACVSVIPKVISVFKWEGKITEEFETFMVKLVLLNLYILYYCLSIYFIIFI